MLTENNRYDACIIGGGLAGLSLAIQLSKNGFGVLLIEKEEYPFHKVCGEYISMESWPFLQSLGVPLPAWNLPRIQQLTVTAPNGNHLTAPLPLGGFGVSRYKLDHFLYQLALQNGVKVLTQCKAENVIRQGNYFEVQTNKGSFNCVQCCGTTLSALNTIYGQPGRQTILACTILKMGIVVFRK
jgi:menaquinone-9 beta-reductase